MDRKKEPVFPFIHLSLYPFILNSPWVRRDELFTEQDLKVHAAADGSSVRTLLWRNRSKIRCVASERFKV